MKEKRKEEAKRIAEKEEERKKVAFSFISNHDI